MMMFLNDNYEGGELILPEYNIKFTPIANSIVLFPSICAQISEKVTSGVQLNS